MTKSKAIDISLFICYIVKLLKNATIVTKISSLKIEEGKKSM